MLAYLNITYFMNFKLFLSFIKLFIIYILSGILPYYISKSSKAFLEANQPAIFLNCIIYTLIQKLLSFILVSYFKNSLIIVGNNNNNNRVVSFHRICNTGYI